MNKYSKNVTVLKRSLGSSVSIVATLCTGRPRTVFRWARDLSRKPSDRLWGPLSLLFNGYSGVKQPEREGDHSLRPSADVKNEWRHTSNPTCVYRARTGQELPLPLPFAVLIYGSRLK